MFDVMLGSSRRLEIKEEKEGEGGLPSQGKMKEEGWWFWVVSWQGTIILGWI